MSVNIYQKNKCVRAMLRKNVILISGLTGLDLLQLVWISLLSYHLDSMKEVIIKISLSEVCCGGRDNMIIVVAETLDKK